MSHEPHDLESEDFVRLRNLPAVPRRSPRPVYGSARFAGEDDLARFLHPPADEDHPSYLPDTAPLYETPTGARLGARYRRKFYLSADVRQRGLMVIGKPGAGKTQKVMLSLAISDLADPRKVVIYPATKGNETDLIQAVVDRTRPGQKVTVVNLADAARTTHAFNPFGRDDDPATALDDAIAFVAASQRPEGHHDSPFWDLSAARFITAVRLALARRFGRVCPADVHEAMEWPVKELLALLAAYPDLPFAPAVHGFLASGSHNAETVLATCQGYLRALRDPDLAAATSAHELDWEAILTAPAGQPGAVVVLEIDVGTLEKLRPVLNLFFLQLFRTACAVAADAPGCRLPRPTCVYLDDFPAAVGRIPACGQYFTTLRSRDCRLTVAVQTTRQLEQFYGPGEAEAIAAALSTTVFCPPVDPADAELASRLAGVGTVIATHRQWKAGRDGRVRPTGHTDSPVARPLLTPDEARLTPEHFRYGRACLLVAPDAPPILLWVRPLFDTPEWGPVVARLARSARRKTLRDVPLARTPLGAAGPSAARVRARLDEARKRLDWAGATPSARAWWEGYERKGGETLAQLLRVAEELAARKATVAEFHRAWVQAGTDNLSGLLGYLDYTRAKEEEAKRRRELAPTTRPAAAASPRPRFKTGEVCGPAQAGRYEFDGYADPDQPRPLLRRGRVVEVKAGDPFPESDGRPCWWRAV